MSSSVCLAVNCFINSELIRKDVWWWLLHLLVCMGSICRKWCEFLLLRWLVFFPSRIEEIPDKKEWENKITPPCMLTLSKATLKLHEWMGIRTIIQYRKALVWTGNVGGTGKLISFSTHTHYVCCGTVKTSWTKVVYFFLVVYLHCIYISFHFVVCRFGWTLIFFFFVNDRVASSRTIFLDNTDRV